MSTLKPETREKLLGISTATLATCLFKRGLRNQFIQGVQRLSKSTKNMVGEAYTLRNIPAREDIDHAGHLGEADDLAIGDVGHVRLAEEREHVMLAHRVELDVAHQHHVVVRLLEEGIADHLGGALLVALRQEAHRLLDPLGRLLEAVTIRILAQGEEHPTDVLLHVGHGNSRKMAHNERGDRTGRPKV